MVSTEDEAEGEGASLVAIRIKGRPPKYSVRRQLRRLLHFSRVLDRGLDDMRSTLSSTTVQGQIADTRFAEMGKFVHAVEGEMLVESTNEKVRPFTVLMSDVRRSLTSTRRSVRTANRSRPNLADLENKSSVGKVDEILGPINEVYFTVKMADGMVATSFTKGDKLYIGGDKLLPLERFLPKPKAPPGQKSAWSNTGHGSLTQSRSAVEEQADEVVTADEGEEGARSLHAADQAASEGEVHRAASAELPEARRGVEERLDLAVVAFDLSFSCMYIVKPRRKRVQFDGRSLRRAPAHRVARRCRGPAELCCRRGRLSAGLQCQLAGRFRRTVESA